MDLYNKNVLYAVSTLGLGHAQRSLPIIRHLLSRKNKVAIIAYGAALILLKEELAQEVNFIELIDYPKLQQEYGLKHYLLLVRDLFTVSRIVRQERRFILNYIQKNQVDCIFADGRYGFYAKNIPSFLICHQIRILVPRLLIFFQLPVDLFQLFFLRKFSKVIVPDFEDKTDNLSGQLSHNWIAQRVHPLYIGFLSSLYRLETQLLTPLDFLFIIGGFLDVEHNKLKSAIMTNIKHLSGNKVLVFGEMEQSSNIVKDDIAIFSHVSGDLRNNLFNQAQVILGWVGYTTVMDLCELGKKGLLTPTHNMTEQAYLARRFKKNAYFSIFAKHELSEIKSLDMLKQNLPQKITKWNTQKSIAVLFDFIQAYHAPGK